MKSKHNLLLCSAMFVMCIAVLYFVPCINVLSIRARLHPREVYYVKTNTLKGFEISYTHSVNKGRVHDYYVILPDNTLLLDKTTFVSYGAGIPEPEETPGAVFTVTDEGYVLSNLQRKLDTFTMAVGIIANHGLKVLYTDGEERYFTMTDLFAPQTSIVYEVVHVSLYRYIKNKL